MTRQGFKTAAQLIAEKSVTFVDVWNKRRRIAELAAHARIYALHGTNWSIDTEHALREALQIIETLKGENHALVEK